MKRFILIVLLLSGFMTLPLSANVAMAPTNCCCKMLTVPPLPGGWLFNVLNGVSFFQNKDDVERAPSGLPQIDERLSSDDTIHAGMFLGYGIAYGWVKGTNRYSLGLELSRSTGELTGTSDRFVLPGENPPTSADPFDYHYNVHSTVLLLRGAWHHQLGGRWQAYQTYVEGGIGNAWNSLSNYHETRRDPTSHVVPGVPFVNKTVSQLAYMVGVGFTYQLSSVTQLSLGYRYLNIGHVESGNLPNVMDANATGHIETPQLGIQQIVFGVEF